MAVRVFGRWIELRENFVDLGLGGAGMKIYS